MRHSSAHPENVCVFVIYIINLDPTKKIYSLCSTFPKISLTSSRHSIDFLVSIIFPTFVSFNFRVLARARLIFGNDERGCGGSSTLRIRPWDRIPSYWKGQRNGRMRQTCLEVDLGSWDPRGTSPKGVSSTSRVFQAGYRLPSLGYPVFDANSDPRESFDHLFHRRLVREREQDRGCGQKGVKARIIRESRFARTRRASITIG